MKRSTVLTEKNRGTWATVFAVIILLPVVLSLVGFVTSPGRREPEVFLEAPNPEWENCVRDAAFMRFHHMDLLKEVRSDVIRTRHQGWHHPGRVWRLPPQPGPVLRQVPRGGQRLPGLLGLPLLPDSLGARGARKAG